MVLPSILLAKSHYQKLQQETAPWLTTKPITIKDKQRLQSLLKTFKSSTIEELQTRIISPPTSLILAQSILESGWGTSRFFREANNIFGIWSYNTEEKRIEASRKRGDKSIYLRAYDTLDESIKDYLLTLSRAPAFSDFRAVKSTSSDPYELCCYLEHYSERRVLYVKDIASIISHNHLIQYDGYTLQEE
jgi:Bax protein